MIYITQLIYVIPGQESVFDEFEAIAIPIIAKYNGRMLLRLKPSGDTILANAIDRPSEVHLVEFASEQDLKNFMADEERKKYLHLKEQSIRSSIFIQGHRMN